MRIERSAAILEYVLCSRFRNFTKSAVLSPSGSRLHKLLPHRRILHRLGDLRGKASITAGGVFAAMNTPVQLVKL